MSGPTSEIKTRKPLSPCHHAHDFNLDGAEAGSPLPTNAPRSWPDLHVYDFVAGEEPPLGSVMITQNHFPGAKEGQTAPYRWLVVGYDELAYCTGVQEYTHGANKGGTVYHEPITLQRVYVSPAHAVRRNEAWRRMRERNIPRLQENFAPIYAEMDAEGWTPEGHFKSLAER